MASVSFLLLLLVLVSCLHAQLSPELSLFHDFIKRYEKTYTEDSEEFNTRFIAFKVASLL